MKRTLTILRALGLVTATLCTACSSIDDTRLPAAPVNIVFADAGMWSVYGVGGAMQSRRFIKSERVPADFPFTASTYTGFGGVLLVCDFFGHYLAYDLSCPVECRQDVRVNIVAGGDVAECPVCHSTYSVFENYGRPVSGIAARDGYGLQRYKVSATAGGGYVITR